MDIILETSLYRLTVGEDCIAKSLILKENNEECLTDKEPTALFSATQARPWNNEIKLAYPNKRTTYQGCHLEKNGSRLRVGFEIVPFKALIDVTDRGGYLVFTVAGYEFDADRDYGGLTMNLPPVTELRLLQLALRERESFGQWLNVSFDQRAAVNVLAVTPEALVDSEKPRDCRLMYAQAVKELGIVGASAALIVSKPEKLMDVIARLEEDYDLPRGVESRRSDLINASVFWTTEICPANADEIIKYAKMGGFRLMLIYYPAIFKGGRAYSLYGDYDYNENYPNGKDDLRLVLKKITDAGLIPGLHVLHTHIGVESRYVTPVCDSRLNHTMRFTLSRAVTPEDDTVYVNENPEGCAMADGTRMLQLGGEVISYEGYTPCRPYAFTGCKHGAYGTVPYDHPAGTVGGILDVSEYGCTSIYLDQNTDLQDEIADKIADAYNEGFKFMYFDGSEGTNEPYAYHVPKAQRRVYDKLSPAPLFTEGAAKAHYGWHHQSGGNAFDVFPADIFKAMIDRFPAEEAPRMAKDFTRVNFGWWAYWPNSQCDMFEYGTSHAAGFDCPATIQMNLATLGSHPRTADLLEVMRRWEDVRAKKWLTEEQKAALRVSGEEYTLIINESGEYELLRHYPLCETRELRAFTFMKDGKAVVAFWNPAGEGEVTLPISAEGLTLSRDLNKPAVDIAENAGCITLKTADRMYITADTPEKAERLRELFRKVQ